MEVPAPVDVVSERLEEQSLELFGVLGLGTEEPRLRAGEERRRASVSVEGRLHVRDDPGNRHFDLPCRRHGRRIYPRRDDPRPQAVSRTPDLIGACAEPLLGVMVAARRDGRQRLDLRPARRLRRCRAAQSSVGPNRVSSQDSRRRPRHLGVADAQRGRTGSVGRQARCAGRKGEASLLAATQAVPARRERHVGRLLDELPLPHQGLDARREGLVLVPDLVGAGLCGRCVAHLADEQQQHPDRDAGRRDPPEPSLRDAGDRESGERGLAAGRRREEQRNHSGRPVVDLGLGLGVDVGVGVVVGACRALDGRSRSGFRRDRGRHGPSEERRQRRVVRRVARLHCAES